MKDPRDYKLDIAGVSNDDDATRRFAGSGSSRPFVSVLFKCCGVYQRIYRSSDGTHYSGRCPRCARPVRFVVGEGGTDVRAFVVE